MDEATRVKKHTPNVGTYLGVSKHREDLYRKYGFMTRKDADLFGGMVLF